MISIELNVLSALDDALKQAQTKLAKQKLKNAGLGAYGSDDSEDESEPPPVEVKKPPKRTVVLEKVPFFLQSFSTNL